MQTNLPRTSIFPGVNVNLSAQISIFCMHRPNIIVHQILVVEERNILSKVHGTLVANHHLLSAYTVVTHANYQENCPH
jgi:hypothetical protein